MQSTILFYQFCLFVCLSNACTVSEQMDIYRVPALALDSRPALKSRWISENWKGPWIVLENEWKAFKKVGICLSWNFRQDLVTVQTCCRSCCKAGRRTAQTILLINVMHECLKLVFFSWVPVGLCAVEWSTWRRALNWPWIIEWKGLEKP